VKRVDRAAHSSKYEVKRVDPAAPSSKCEVKRVDPAAPSSKQILRSCSLNSNTRNIASTD